MDVVQCMIKESSFLFFHEIVASRPGGARVEWNNELQFSSCVKFQRLTVRISEICCSLVLFACQEIREY